MQIALTRLDQALRDEPVLIIATVHDEAMLLVPDDVDSVERIGAIAQQGMIAAFLEVFPDAPTMNLVNFKVWPTWGDLQALPDWLQNHRPTESNVSSGESIESAMVAVEYMDEAAPVPLQTNFFTSATRWSESSARITSNSITKAAAL